MNSSPEFQRKTPSPQNCPKPASIKTPLLPAAHIPDLSAFHTPGTPGYLTSSCSTNNYRLSSPILGKWQQNHVSENSDSDESNDDLRVYAAAAGDAMQDSDEDIFSIRLPESPESYEKPGTFSHCANKQTLMNSYTAKKIPQPSQQNIREGTKRSHSEEQSPLRVAKKSRPRKRTWTHKKNSRKSIISNECDEDEDNLLYNSCASVDCIHPHKRDKLIDWVQCDDCNDWCHVKCTGLTLESVRPKSAKFHCGCA